MSTVSCFKFDPPSHDPIPPDGTLYLALGPFDGYSGGAITVTAHPIGFGPDFGTNVMYMEVIQMATRFQVVDNAPQYFLDIVVRNNSHMGDVDASSIRVFTVFVSIAMP